MLQSSAQFWPLAKKGSAYWKHCLTNATENKYDPEREENGLVHKCPENCICTNTRIFSWIIAITP